MALCIRISVDFFTNEKFQEFFLDEYMVAMETVFHEKV